MDVPALRPALRRDARGAVYVEFLLVFLPVFLLFLAILELGFIYAGRLVVQHASTRAARAAVVVIDDDPAFYGGAPRGRVVTTGSTMTPSPVEIFLAGAGLGSAASDSAGGPRFRDIRSAASIPLLAVAPSAAQLEGQESVRTAIGTGPQRAITGAQRYNGAALAVTFPTAPGAGSFRTTFGRDEMITVRVTYLLHCGVPLVPALMCRSTGGLELDPEEAAQMDLAYLAGLARPRFQVLRAETTLRNQGAAYLYPSETAP
jgi:Flp pilus assembly protein TadG